MEKLMKPAEYALSLGISRQAVYAKIKRGVLSSKNVEGKLYIVLDNDTNHASMVNTTPVNTKLNKEVANIKDYKALLEAKDETILVLKETVIDLKESNKQISTTLRGEIDLLKEAFHEMRTLYRHQLEHKPQESNNNEKHEESKDEEVIEIFTEEAVKEEEPKVKWIGIKKFFKMYNVTKEKAQEKLTKRLKKAYKKGDNRLSKDEDKLKLDLNKNYEDILQ